MDSIDALFARKTREAADIIATRQTKEIKESNQEVPFEVNKVLRQINQETQRRAKVLKRKPQ